MIKKAAISLVVLLGSLGWASGDATAAAGTEATFEGRTIDLASDWADATACLESTGQVTCYRTEREMLDASAEQTALSKALADADDAVAATACSSSLRLYNGTGFTGTVVMLTSRQTILNLSNYGFDNMTSSYKVGACSTSLYSSANLGGSALSAGANTTASSMPSGWEDISSSVWIG